MMSRPTIRRLLGALLLTQFAVVCVVNLAGNTPAQIWWISHAALVLGAVGMIVDRPVPLLAALTAILVLHAAWLLDVAGWFLTGDFPLGATTHLVDAGFWRWLATAHHFYLAPMLILALHRRAAGLFGALALCIAVFSCLTILSRLWLPAQANINYAFMVPRSTHPIVVWGNELHAVWYLLTYNAIVAVSIFFPTAVFMHKWLRERDPDEATQTDRPHSASDPSSPLPQAPRRR